MTELALSSFSSILQNATTLQNLGATIKYDNVVTFRNNFQREKPIKNRGYYLKDFSPIFIKKRIMRTAKAYNANSKSV